VLQIVDFYGATFVAFILAVGELLAFCFIYGVDRICKDVEFMLGIKLNLYWKVCWRYLTPGLMIVIVIYTLWNFEIPKDGNFNYPLVAHVAGWSLAVISLIQVPIFAVYKVYHQRKNQTLWEVKSFYLIRNLQCKKFFFRKSKTH
jgi:solute carrier family 6 (neurotransmitter transporter, glycine) member 5/9